MRQAHAEGVATLKKAIVAIEKESRAFGEEDADEEEEEEGENGETKQVNASKRRNTESTMRSCRGQRAEMSHRKGWPARVGHERDTEQPKKHHVQSALKSHSFYRRHGAEIGVSRSLNQTAYLGCRAGDCL